MKTLLRRPGFGGFLFAQAQVAFNDNATKLILIGLVQWLLAASEASRLISMISLLLVAPFVLFAPLTGWLADRYARRDVVSASLWLQLAVMILLCGAAFLHSLPLAVGGFFLLGLQSAIMSPARWGMAKELAGENVGEAVGLMEMLGIAAILLGSLAGGFFIDTVAPLVGSPWSAAVLVLGVLGRQLPGSPSLPSVMFPDDPLLHPLRSAGRRSLVTDSYCPRCAKTVHFGALRSATVCSTSLAASSC